MDNSNHSQGERKFFNGFLLGLLVGAAVVFFLGTKKGKRIWKAISEKGMGNISTLLNEAEKTANLDEVIGKEEAFFIKTKNKKEEAVSEAVIRKPVARRFFRGISRHAN